MPSKDIHLSAKQMEFLRSEARQTLFEAGIGAGKSYCGAIWAFMMTQKYPGSRGLIVARDVPQLRNATLIEFKKALNLFGQVENVDYTHNKSTNEYSFSNGSVIVATGANNYDSAFRGPSYSWMWLDEADFYKPEAYKTAKGRLRAHPEQMKITSSPKGYNFIYDDFYTNAGPSKQLISCTSFEGLTLSDDYLESLKSSYSPRLYQQEVLAQRVSLNSGAVYSEFQRDIHLKDLSQELGPNDPLFFFLDYNIAHYCGAFMTFKDDTLKVVDEIHLKDKNSLAMAQAIKAKYPNRPVIIQGDSSGNNTRNTSANLTNYEIFREQGFQTRHLNNPPVISRVMAVESALHHKKIEIDPRCETLIKDLELVSWKASGTNQIDKTSDPSITHMSDAFGYGVWNFLPLRRPQQKSQALYI